MKPYQMKATKVDNDFVLIGDKIIIRKSNILEVVESDRETIEFGYQYTNKSKRCCLIKLKTGDELITNKTIEEIYELLQDKHILEVEDKEQQDLIDILKKEIADSSIFTTIWNNNSDFKYTYDLLSGYTIRTNIYLECTKDLIDMKIEKIIIDKKEIIIE